MAQAAGAAFPVMITTDGRPVLKYSELLPRNSTTVIDTKPEAELLAASNARLRAERLKALKSQSPAAALVSPLPPAASSAPAPAAATAAARGDDSDEEGFLHAAAVGKLPGHLTRTESQESDSDVIIDKQDEEEGQSAESEKKMQESRHDRQAAYKPR